PGGESPPGEAHRGQGRRRAFDHDGGRSQGSPPPRHRRTNGSRAARFVRRELIPILTLLGACDTGDRTDQITAGPFITVVSTNTINGLPADGAIELTFNRLLLPSAVTRQTISLRTAGNMLVDPPPVIVYDPVLLKVRIQNANASGGTWLMPGQP